MLNFLVIKNLFNSKKKMYSLKSCLNLNLKQDSYIIYKHDSVIKTNSKPIK